jgi:hypothetical protein
MPHRLKRLVPLVGIAVALVVTLNASAAKKVTCDTAVNDTAAKLLPCITQDDLTGYMNDLWDIAVANPGPDNHPSRSAGEPGYLASVMYVKGLMDSWGYHTTIQQYTIPYYSYGTVGLSEVSPTAHDFALNDDWIPGQTLGGSPVTAPIQPVGGIVDPPTDTPSSASGCDPSDFAGFTPGNIALIQRGTCFYSVKLANAEAAGASGLIIFNEGQVGRTAPTQGGFFDDNGNTFFPDIPVAFVSWQVGHDLLAQYNAGHAPVMTLRIDATFDPARPDYNLIADSNGGDKNHTVVIDAHLDAIYGAGMLDNASGSVTILDIARMMRNVNTTNHLRYIWFGGEELGLLGSSYYVSTLPSKELSHIGYDLDADVTSTPNYILGILDPAARDLFSDTGSETFPNRVYKASLIARDAGVEYLNSLNLNHEFISPVGTDAYSFNKAGIPASGVLTGQDCCKSQAEVDLFGGSTGIFEGVEPNGCVDLPFLWCDNIGNNDFGIMTTVSQDFATMVLRMAFDTKVMSSSGSAVYKKSLPISGEVTRHFQAK